MTVDYSVRLLASLFEVRSFTRAWMTTGFMIAHFVISWARPIAWPNSWAVTWAITNLHVAIGQGSGLAMFHGPGLSSMGLPQRTAFTWDSVVNAFTKGGVGPVPRDPDDPYVRSLSPGKVTAPIVGGNLSTMVHLIGTPWEPDLDGAILFFEEVDTTTDVLEIHLQQLRLAGKLDGVVGVVVSELYHCDWREEFPDSPRMRSLEDALENQLCPLGVPVLYKLPLGHGKHLASIPLGVAATLDADARTLTIDQPGVVANS